jgi:hypothetical protein
MVDPKLVALPSQKAFVTPPSCLGEFNLERMNVPQPDLVGAVTANTENREGHEARRKDVHCERYELFEKKVILIVSRSL